MNKRVKRAPFLFRRRDAAIRHAQFGCKLDRSAPSAPPGARQALLYLLLLIIEFCDRICFLSVDYSRLLAVRAARDGLKFLSYRDKSLRLGS